MRDNVDRLLEQWRAERPDVDPAPMGVVARILRTARLLERELRDNFAADVVSRETDPTNRRSMLITLTDSGRELTDEVVVGHVDREARLLSALDPSEQEHLSELLRKLLTSLGDTCSS